MNSTDVLIDAFGRVRGVVDEVLKDLSPEQVARRITEDSNSIAWLIWHLTRVQDDHVAGVSDRQQVYTSQGWVEKFELPFDPTSTGWGHSSEDVAAVKADADLLRSYHQATYDQTIAYLGTLNDDDMGEVIDERFDPPVTRAVRLVSVIEDSLQHAGQAAFIRGIIE